MTRNELLDLYFIDARSKLIDLAAFLDRLDRAEGEADYRLAALRQALEGFVHQATTGRAEKVLLTLSDPTEEPVDKAPGQSAAGAWLQP